MHNRAPAANLSALELPLNRRNPSGSVYFVRIAACNNEVSAELSVLAEAARHKGLILEKPFGNPDERQLAYLQSVLGTGFAMSESFLLQAAAKWLPGMKADKHRELSQLLLRQLNALQMQGKSESILRNFYYKIMCWLYDPCQKLLPCLGENELPKLLYLCCGITRHELYFLSMLSALGCDLLLVEPEGDEAYLKIDSGSTESQLLPIVGSAFPKDFSLLALPKPKPVQPKSEPVPSFHSAPTPAAPSPIPPRPAIPMQPRNISLEDRFPKPKRLPCTNAWMKEADYGQILLPQEQRKADLGFFCNAYIRMKGAHDKLSYAPELYQFYEHFRETHRNLVIVDEKLPLPDPDEIDTIRRRPYHTAEELIADLALNLPGCANYELQCLMQRSFVKVMQDEAKLETQLNRLTVSGVYLLCRIKRYQSGLFQGYNGKEIPCFVLMGGCQSRHDAAYLRFLSELPADVLILAPDKEHPCTLEDPRLLDLEGKDSMPVKPFPKNGSSLKMSTVASFAERELDTVLYNQSGLYRNRQFPHAQSIILQTTYDEIFILWNQELRYRSNFTTHGQQVNMPVIYARISGIEKGDVNAYWQKIKPLTENGAIVIRNFPYQAHGELNPYQSLATSVLKNGYIKRDVLKASPKYPFALLREDLQEHMLDKLQLMLDHKLIKGCFVNGSEYTVIATVLNLKKELLRTLQSFDFTKSNPKIVCLSTNDSPASLEDAIILTFLNLVGFDILLFVPTGYQILENQLDDNYPVNHEIGDYVYDLSIPDFSLLPPPKNPSWFTTILKRGH